MTELLKHVWSLEAWTRTALFVGAGTYTALCVGAG